MTYRSIKLGLVLALLALGAVGAQAAQAGEFTAAQYPATITGVQTTKHQWKFNMGTVKCASVSFDGEQAAASNTLTLSAEYKECVTGKGNPAVVKMTSCDYRFHAGETLAMNEVDGSLDIQCNQAGDGIDVEVPGTGCAVKIQAQAGLNTLRFTDRTAAEDYDVDFAITGMAYKQNANCEGGEGSFANGEYSGTSTITGSHEGAAVGVTVD